MSTQKAKATEVGPIGKFVMVVAAIAFPIALIVGIIAVWPPPEEQSKLDRVLEELAELQSKPDNDGAAEVEAAEEKAAAEEAAKKNAEAERLVEVKEAEAKTAAEQAAAAEAVAHKAAEEKENAEKTAKEKRELEKEAAAQAAAAKTAWEKAAAERTAAAKAVEAKPDADKAAAQELAEEKVLAEKAAEKKVAMLTAAAAKAAAERATAEKEVAEKAVAAKVAAEKAATANAAAEKAGAEKAAARKAAKKTADEGNDGEEEEDGDDQDEPEIDIESRLILLVILVGALGSYIGLATSFVGYAGNRRLKRSWVPWYLIRPFTGSGLALLFYFVVRGGFVSATSDGNDINLYGILAVAGLAGLFSKHAMKKLEEVFKDMFKVDDDSDGNLQDPLGPPPAPVIDSITPDRSPANEALDDVKIDVKITGKNFADTAKVQFGDKEISPKKVSATELTFDLKAKDFPETGKEIDVKVVNPDDQGGASEAKKFKVT